MFPWIRYTKDLFEVIQWKRLLVTDILTVNLVKTPLIVQPPPLYRHRQKPLLLLWFPLIALMCVLDGSDRKALSSCCTAKAYTAQTDASGEHGQAFSSLGTQMFPSGAGWRRPGLTIKAMLSEQRGERLQCFYCCWLCLPQKRSKKINSYRCAYLCFLYQWGNVLIWGLDRTVLFMSIFRHRIFFSQPQTELLFQIQLRKDNLWSVT